MKFYCTTLVLQGAPVVVFAEDNLVALKVLQHQNPLHTVGKRLTEPEMAEYGEYVIILAETEALRDGGVTAWQGNFPQGRKIMLPWEMRA